MKTERKILEKINKFAEEYDYKSGSYCTEDYIYEYLIEGWESGCIEKVVIEENGNWDDDEYLYGIVDDLHNKIIKTDTQFNKYKEFEIIKNEVIEGSQFGKSLIIIKIKKSDINN